MAADPSLSVIIPAYNAGQTLRACVASVVLQAVESMEIIIVDDGSTDDTALVAAALRHEYAQVRVLQQTNQGLAAARNSGLSAAQGDLLTFVDSDDTLAAGTYLAVLKVLAALPTTDIAEYEVQFLGDKEKGQRLVLADNTYTAPYGYWIGARGYEHCYACNKIFRRRVFFPKKGSPQRFPVGVAFEDVAFMLALLAANPVISTLSCGTYNYRRAAHGLSASATAEDLAQLLAAHLTVVADYSLSSKPLTRGEEDYYYSVVNLQLTLCQRTGEAPLLPSRRLPLRRGDGHYLPRLVKKLLLSVVGLPLLCRLYRRLPVR